MDKIVAGASGVASGTSAIAQSAITSVAPLYNAGMTAASIPEKIRMYNQLQRDIDDAEDLYQRSKLLIKSIKGSGVNNGPINRLEKELIQLYEILYVELNINDEDKSDIGGIRSLFMTVFGSGKRNILTGKMTEKYKILFPDWYSDRIVSINRRILNTIDLVGLEFSNHNSHMLRAIMNKLDIKDTFTSTMEYDDVFNPIDIMIPPDEIEQLADNISKRVAETAAAKRRRRKKRNAGKPTVSSVDDEDDEDDVSTDDFINSAFARRWK